MKKRTLRDPLSYKERKYRHRSAEDLVASHVSVQETDLSIHANCDVTQRAMELVLQYRLQLEEYIRGNPAFLNSLEPLPVDVLAPKMITDMYNVAKLADVGPMAAVAGTMACYIGSSLIKEGVKEIIVENGGDIYLNRSKESIIGIYAGESPLSYKVGLRINPEQMPCGICTSSGTIGHSLSLGKADSVTVLAQSVALADAAATRLGNEVGVISDAKKGVKSALDLARKIEGLLGVVIICNETLGAVGDLDLVKLK
jgi:uncharacterized protein